MLVGGHVDQVRLSPDPDPRSWEWLWAGVQFGSQMFVAPIRIGDLRKLVEAGKALSLVELWLRQHLEQQRERAIAMGAEPVRMGWQMPLHRHVPLAEDLPQSIR